MTFTSRALGALLAALLACPAGAQSVPGEGCPPPAACADARQPRTVRLTFYNQSRAQQADIESLLDVANRIWSQYGVRLQRGTGPGAVAVVLADRRVLPDDANRQVLGTTLFTDGHATPYIKLSMAAAETFAESTHEGGVQFTLRPLAQRDATLMRVLGVALAHEIAHYLLDTAAHSSAGLLQPGLDMHELSSAEPAHLKLTAGQQRRLRLAADSSCAR
jgi:hypothetical protein